MAKGGTSALVHAERKGREAAMSDKARTACPYQDNGPLSFARKFRVAWLKGFDGVKR